MQSQDNSSYPSREQADNLGELDINGTRAPADPADFVSIDGISFVSASAPINSAADTSPEMVDTALVALKTPSSLPEIASTLVSLFPALAGTASSQNKEFLESVRKILRAGPNRHRFEHYSGTRAGKSTTLYTVVAGSAALSSSAASSFGTRSRRSDTSSNPIPLYDTTLCTLCGTGENEAQMLLCDTCDCGFHLYCVKPTLSKIPEGEWYCQFCLEQEGERGLTSLSSKDIASIQGQEHRQHRRASVEFPSIPPQEQRNRSQAPQDLDDDPEKRVARLTYSDLINEALEDMGGAAGTTEITDYLDAKYGLALLTVRTNKWKNGVAGTLSRYFKRERTVNGMRWFVTKRGDREPMKNKPSQAPSGAIVRDNRIEAAADPGTSVTSDTGFVDPSSGQFVPTPVLLPTHVQRLRASIDPHALEHLMYDPVRLLNCENILRSSAIVDYFATLNRLDESEKVQGLSSINRRHPLECLTSTATPPSGAPAPKPMRVPSVEGGETLFVPQYARRLPLRQAGHVFQVEFSNEGSILASCSTSGSIRMWDVMNELTPEMTPDVRMAAFARQVHHANANGSVKSSGSSDSVKYLDEPAAGDLWQLLREMTDPQDPEEDFYALAWSPDDRRIAAAGRRRVELGGSSSETSRSSIKIFDPLTGRVMLRLTEHTREILCLKSVMVGGGGSALPAPARAFAENVSSCLFSGGQDGRIIKWELDPTWSKVLRVRDLPTASRPAVREDPLARYLPIQVVTSLDMVPNTGNTIMVAACDTGVALFDVERETQLQRFTGIYGYLCDFTKVLPFVPDLPLLYSDVNVRRATAPEFPWSFYVLTRGVELVDAAKGAPTSTNSLNLHRLTLPMSVAAEPKSYGLTLRETFTHTRVTELGRKQLAKLESVGVFKHPDYQSNIWMCKPACNGRYVLAPAEHGKIFIWAVATQELTAILNDHTNVVRCVTLHPHRPLAVSCDNDGAIHVYGQPKSSNEYTRQLWQAYDSAWQLASQACAASRQHQLHVRQLLATQDSAASRSVFHVEVAQDDDLDIFEAPETQRAALNSTQITDMQRQTGDLAVASAAPVPLSVEPPGLSELGRPRRAKRKSREPKSDTGESARSKKRARSAHANKEAQRKTRADRRSSVNEKAAPVVDTDEVIDTDELVVTAEVIDEVEDLPVEQVRSAASRRSISKNGEAPPKRPRKSKVIAADGVLASSSSSYAHDETAVDKSLPTRIGPAGIVRLPYSCERHRKKKMRCPLNCPNRTRKLKNSDIELAQRKAASLARRAKKRSKKVSAGRTVRQETECVEGNTDLVPPRGSTARSTNMATLSRETPHVHNDYACEEHVAAGVRCSPRCPSRQANKAKAQALAAGNLSSDAFLPDNSPLDSETSGAFGTEIVPLGDAEAATARNVYHEGTFDDTRQEVPTEVQQQAAGESTRRNFTQEDQQEDSRESSPANTTTNADHDKFL